MKRAISLVDGIFAMDRTPTRGEHLVFRLFECVVVSWLCFYAWVWALRGAGSPTPYFSGTMQALGTYGTAGVISVLLLAGWSRREDRYAYLVAVPVLHVLFALAHWPYAGKHHSHVLGMALLAFGMGRLIHTRPAERVRFTLGLSYTILALVYSLACLSKLREAGLGWANGENFSMIMHRVQVSKWMDHGDPWRFDFFQSIVVNHVWLGTLIMASGMAAEFFSFLICWERSRPYIVTALLMMHLGIAFTMYIVFPTNTILLLLLGYPWARLLDRRLDQGLLQSRA